MRGVAAAERVHVRGLGHATLLHRKHKRLLETGRPDWTDGRIMKRSRGAATRCWEHPHGIPVRAPVCAEERESRLGNRDHPIDATLAVVDVEQPAGAIDMGHVEIRSFQQPKSAGVDRRQARAIRGRAHRAEHLPDRVPAQYDWELLRPLRPSDVENRPVATKTALGFSLERRDGGFAALRCGGRTGDCPWIIGRTFLR